MTYRTIRRLFAFLLVAGLAAFSVLGQEYKALLGTWNMTSETDSDSVKWTLVLKESDGKLGAFLSTDEGEQPAKDFVYKEGTLKFKAPYQGQDYVIELKSKADTLDGTWAGNGDSGKTSGTRKAE